MAARVSYWVLWIAVCCLLTPVDPKTTLFTALPRNFGVKNIFHQVADALRLLELDKGLNAFGLERRESIIRIEDRDRLGNGRILVRAQHVAVVVPAQ